MSTRHHLLHLLADGAFHSGTALGERLGVSRAAVNKAVQSWVDEGADIHAVPGRGYRLAEPLVPLSAEAIQSALAARGLRMSVEVVEQTASTSELLLRAGIDRAVHRAVLAEVQSAGRGRRGRGWVATPYHNILLSLAWRFEAGPAALAGLSLAAGVAVLRSLDALGVRRTGLKWPNDVLLDGRKLAGLLIDVRGEAGGPSFVVVGLGLNVHLAEHDARAIDQPWAALREVLPAPVDRNRLAVLLLAELAAMLALFERDGFAPWRAEWEQRHFFQNRTVCLQVGSEQVTGTALGIDTQGGLRLRDARGVERAFHSGEISLRAVS
jgi:BirA family biotin operon repressor/biotin-[acetyl-CoA-carboxylase] ligase